MADVKNGTSRGVDEGSSNSYAPATTTSNHTLGVVIDAIIEPRRTEPRPKRRMKEVPLTMRDNENNKGYFGPRVVSLGPYHHGKEELQEVKPIVAQLFISSSGIDMNEFCKMLLEIVDDARSCYLEGSTDKYSNEDAQAMQSARNSSRMREESYATGVAILAQYAGQRVRLKVSVLRQLLFMATYKHTYMYTCARLFITT
ncbi:hypothetical protein RHSIM_Rhsim02G0196100 [Rhododendron simsii]|uniref:Uncharacterized protein n=1 Tax=Rhododendron simsii TaxID=118357 RepID=A0A834LXU9_RHOSS|nr:hypothetical protein RHSIM_Rhsim02G0196100 [Rhododendron simsii]